MRIGSAALAAILLSLAIPAAAQWPSNVTQNVPVAVGPGNIASMPPWSQAVADGSGGVIFVWSDNRNGSYHIFGQRYDAAGAALWTPGGKTLYSGAGDQDLPVAISDGFGGAVIVFANNSGANGKDIYSMRVDGNGNALWAFVNMSAPSNQYPGQFVRLSSGSFMIAIFDDRNMFDLWVLPIALDGSTPGPQPIAVVAGGLDYPSVVPDDVGGAYLFWNDFRSVGGNNVWGQHVNSGGGATWAANGMQITGTNLANSGVTACADGFGGALVVYSDAFSGRPQLAMSHFDITGANSIGSRFFTSGPYDFYPTSLIEDGEGGCHVGMLRYDAGNLQSFVQHVGPLGQVITVPASVGPGISSNVRRVMSDGEGGVFAMGYDYPTGYSPTLPFVQHVNSYGNTDWPGGGLWLTNSPGSHGAPTVATTDGNGGLYALWLDGRAASTNGWDLYAMHVARYGRLGNPEPRIASARDVPNDQGGRVEVRWAASYLDKATNQQIQNYWVWREAPIRVAQAALAAGAKLAGREKVEPRAGERLFRLESNAAGTSYWEYVAQQAATGFANYSLVVATTGDSVPGSNPRTKFMVEAWSWSSQHWESAPDSGYSVDNLPPGPPAPIAVVYGGSSTWLHWSPNGEADLAGYRVYRGTTPDFPTDATTLLGAPADTQFTAPGTSHLYYKLIAVDAHGNPSAARMYSPGAVTGVPMPVATGLELARPQPNPTWGPVTLRFALPAAGPVRLAVHDAQGRLVRVLVDSERPAGAQTLAWDLRDAGGARVTAGLYFVRCVAAGRALTQRLVALE